MFWRNLAWLCLLGACGLRAIDCPPGEVEAAASSAADQWPGAVDVIDRLDVICKGEGEVYGGAVPCVAPWFGSPTARARFIVEYDLALECVAHEAHHAALWSDTDDACVEHTEGCGWSYVEVEAVVDAALEELP